MLGKIESVQILSQFVLCYKSNYCQAGRCLRYQVTDYVSEKWHIVDIVNSAFILLGEECELFKTYNLIKYAYGYDGGFGLFCLSK